MIKSAVQLALGSRLQRYGRARKLPTSALTWQAVGRV